MQSLLSFLQVEHFILLSYNTISRFLVLRRAVRVVFELRKEPIFVLLRLRARTVQHDGVHDHGGDAQERQSRADRRREREELEASCPLRRRE